VCFCLGISCNDSNDSNGPYRFMSYYVEERGNSVACDSSGNVFIVGNFTGATDFVPGSGSVEFISKGLIDGFCGKFDSYGAFSWARTWPNSNWTSGVDYVAVDGSGGVFIAGVFGGDVDFDPGTSEDIHYGPGAFLSCYDSGGNYKWAETFTARSVHYLAVDGTGNIYMTGEFNTNVPTDFDPGPGVDEYSGRGIYISKFNSEGNFIWVSTFDGLRGAGTRLAFDNEGNIYIAGVLSGVHDFDPGPEAVKLAGFDTPFLSKYDPDGNFEWVREVSGTFKCMNTSIAVGLDSNIYLCGTFSNPEGFVPDPVSDSMVSNGEEDIFLDQFDSSGELIWERTTGGPESDFCNGIAMDGNGNIYLTGYFENTVDFDPGPSVAEQKSNGGFNIYLSKLDSSGNFVWVRTWGGSGWDKGNAIAFDPTGSLYITGEFCDRVDFDPGSGTDWHESTGYNDIFLSKFDLDGNFKWAHTWGGSNPLFNSW
jgi:hypothetical protein